MGTAADAVDDRPVEGSVGDAAGPAGAATIDALAAQRRVVSREQAREVALMVEFADARRAWDQRRIGDLEAEGRDARYRAGEFAAVEIAMAVTASRYSVRQVMAVARRLRGETPDAYDAWQAGEIDQPRAVKINHALLRLTRDASKQLLNSVVVDIAVCKTVELLGRWLNEFVARVEPDQTDERLRRSLADRYVSVRPDLDGISFLSAAVSSVDANAVDQVLTALAAAAEPGDPRTMQQRRADALIDVLLGRVSNGCHVTWMDGDGEDGEPGRAGGNADGTADEAPGRDHGSRDRTDAHDRTDDDDGGCGAGTVDGAPLGDEGAGADEPGCGPSVDNDAADVDPDSEWELPASAFRPEPQAGCSAVEPDPADDHVVRAPDSGSAVGSDPDADADADNTDADADAETVRRGRVVVTPCAGNHASKPVPAVIGVIVSAQSLFGFSNTPGQLIDRSALVPADTIRALAQQPGTLFHRLLTDERGNLLDVTELGRFPSRKLGLAINYRDGVCVRPGCHTSAAHCDHDHVVPVPEGPTNAGNLKNECRPDHRAKTHAAHEITRIDRHTTRWTTPTGHEYFNRNDPLPVEDWGGESDGPKRSGPDPEREGPAPGGAAGP